MNPTASAAVTAHAPKVTHYENFPVASLLCPPHLRPAIQAIYAFARTADDIADEGQASADTRLTDLQAFAHDLQAVHQGRTPSARWPEVFTPLRRAMQEFKLPLPLLDALLDAFAQDVRHTSTQNRYQNDNELLHYCQRSANPVGRLLLHLYGMQDALSLSQSDHICTALQLINFWQDLSVDHARRRWYVTQQSQQYHGVSDADLQTDRPCPSASRLVADNCTKARELLLLGAPLTLRLPGRAGWELRLVVQGGLTILDKLAAMNHESWRRRVRLGAPDMPLLLWRVLRMPARINSPQAMPPS